MLIRQIKAVLMTYLTRRVYHVLLITMLIGVAIGWFASRHQVWRWPITSVLVGGFVTFLVPGSVIVALILFFLQAREQVMGLNARLFPQSRTAYLIVIGVLFFGLTVAISSVSWERPSTYHIGDGKTYWNDGVSPVGAAIVVLVFMTLTGYSACRPWLSPVLGFALILAIIDKGGWINFITTWFGPSGGSGIWAGWHQMEVDYQWSLRAAVFLANIIALQLLVKLARPRPERASLLSMLIHRMAASPSKKFVSIACLAAHVPITGVLSRGRRRRFAVHSHKAPWALAASMAIALAGTMLISEHTRNNDRVMAALVMLTIVPGVVVAAGWRERWTSLGYESLLPSRRVEFVSEIAIALAADLVEFWIAALATMILVLAAFTPRSLATGTFMASIAASAMMQMLWLGAIFLTSRFRQVAPYVVVLVGAGLLMLLPIFQAWQDPHGPLIPYLIAVASAEMTAGLISLLSALGLWRSADLA